MSEDPTTSQTIRVLVIDDHEIMRSGIRFLLHAFEDLNLVGEATRGEDAVAACKESKPNVVLMDLKLGKMDGVDATKLVLEHCPDVQVLVISSFHDPDLVRKVMDSGAVGYLLKDTEKDQLGNAIRAAAKGRITLSPEIAEDLVSTPRSSRRVVDALTAREMTILRLMAAGLTNIKIAAQIHRSPFTVRHHVSQILSKLSVANRAEAVAVASELGLLEDA